MTTIWSFPTRILFGAGTIDQSGPEAKRFAAKKALVVTDPGIRDAGLVVELTRSLEQAGVATVLFNDVSTNPTEAEVLAAAASYTDSGADLVVGFGGGAPIDVAKLVRLATTHPLPLAQYEGAIGGEAKITGPLPPMIAIPTTAGTGSEVARTAMVTIEETRRKTVIFSPRLMADVAILDPALTFSLPGPLTAATGFDALTHSVEAYCAKGAHPMADAIALAGIELIARHIVAAVEEGRSLEARSALLEASMMGAVANQKGLGACHALAHPLAAELGMHHGLANALCLPAVLDFNRIVAEMRIARIARILGVKGNDLETLAFECSGAVRALRKQIGLADGLAAAGVSEEHLTTLAPLAQADSAHADNPRPCVKEDMLALYRASM